jgi:hypothetical protein
MIYRYAIIQSNIVWSVVVWDGVAPWEPPEGTELLQLADGERCGGGWTYEAGATPRFIPPADIPPE